MGERRRKSTLILGVLALPGRDDRAGYGRINMERALVPYILD
jgi:hypothetical protein